MTIKVSIGSLCFYLLLSGCTFNFELTSQRTALENQVMGVYQELDDEVLLLSTMRGTQHPSAGARAAPQAIIEHRRNQEFNRDDIEELKDRGWIGERVDGRVGLVEKNTAALRVRQDLELTKKLIDEENRDREAIWTHILKKIPHAPALGLKQVGQAYGDTQRAKLSIGQWYEQGDGQWRKKASGG